MFTGSNVSSTTKGDCSNYEYDDGSLKIGDTVAYSTSLNGVTLDDWKVFYIEGDYTYLIYGGYLPNTTIDTTILTGVLKIEDYCIYTYNGNYPDTSPYYIYNQNPEQLLSALKNVYWNNLLTGTLNNHNISLTPSDDVWAMGSPTTDLWINSWNASYPNNNVIENEYGSYERVETDNKLFFPEFPEDVYITGYWLASQSDVYILDNVQEWGGVNGVPDAQELSIRPVIKLPTDVLTQ